MVDQMVFGAPRFRPVRNGNIADNSADDDEAPRPHDIGNSGRIDRRTRMAAHVVHRPYRIKTAYVSWGFFLIGTGMTITALVTGK